MSARADGLPEGPRRPLPETPPRPRRSVRRTTSIDQRRGDPGEPQHVLALGRDLLTRADGTTEVLDEARVEVTVDPTGTVVDLRAEPPVPELAVLVGGSVRKGIRGRVDSAVPAHAAGASVLHQLLDDLPMASLISSYGSSREQPDFRMPAASAERMTDLCSGWAAGATMLQALGSTGVFPIPVGPPAPDLARTDDPLAWHDLPPMAPRSVRRRRRIDLAVGEGGALEADLHFRDSHLGRDELEDVLHEYTLAATLDPETLEVLSSEADARVLPWPECPGALASAGRVVGQRVGGLRMSVAVRFTGTSTCTHLNDTLRSLAGAAALAPALR